MARSALSKLLFGALLLLAGLATCNADDGTAHRVDSQQRFEGLSVASFDRRAFQTSIASYFSIDADLVRKGAGAAHS